VQPPSQEDYSAILQSQFPSVSQEVLSPVLQLANNNLRDFLRFAEIYQASGDVHRAVDLAFIQKEKDSLERQRIKDLQQRLAASQPTRHCSPQLDL